jgi:beta-glucosidase
MTKTPDSKTAFLWGAATSSHQIEGHNQHNDWWAWEAKGKVDGGVRSGAATDHLNRFREDMRLAKELGLNSYRFSFEWSRFEPLEGAWEKTACDWYGELISECEAHGLLPMATLLHFTIPQWLAEQGGFASDETPEKFARFTRKIAAQFGSRIPIWCTVNEPMVLVSGSYLARFMPPSEYNPTAASTASANLFKCHVLAYDILKSEITVRQGPFREHPVEVGFAHNMMHFLPERRFHPFENFLARILSFLHNDAWLIAVNGEKQKFGFAGIFPPAKQYMSGRNRRTYDFIGINYYTKSYIRWRPRTHNKDFNPELQLGINFARRGEVASDLEWAIHPRGFKLMLEKLRRFKAPIYITENGIADSKDQYRRDYLQKHLHVVAEAIKSGLDIRGYYYWSLLDNFEWVKGFWPRFGLYAVDYDSFVRTARPSAAFYRDVIKAHANGESPSVQTIYKLST